MRLRTLFASVNLVAFLAVAVWLTLHPPGSSLALLYILLGWMVGSLIVMYGPWGNRPIGSAASPASGSKPFADVPFCIYCGAPLTANTVACPTCGHTVPQG
jgi:hypothetical protein